MQVYLYSRRRHGQRKNVYMCVVCETRAVSVPVYLHGVEPDVRFAVCVF